MSLYKIYKIIYWKFWICCPLHKKLLQLIVMQEVSNIWLINCLRLLISCNRINYKPYKSFRKIYIYLLYKWEQHSLFNKQVLINNLIVVIVKININININIKCMIKIGKINNNQINNRKNKKLNNNYLNKNNQKMMVGLLLKRNENIHLFEFIYLFILFILI